MNVVHAPTRDAALEQRCPACLSMCAGTCYSACEAASRRPAAAAFGCANMRASIRRQQGLDGGAGQVQGGRRGRGFA